MNHLILTILWIALATGDTGAGQATDPVDTSEPAADEAIFCDRLDQTFRLLCGVTYAVYEDHFHDERKNLGAVHYYEGRLAFVQMDLPAAIGHFRASCLLAPDSFYGFSSARWLMAESKRMSDLPAEDKLQIEAIGNGELSSFATENPRQMDVLSAIVADARSDTAGLSRSLQRLGDQAHVLLHRNEISDSGVLTARCPLFDPDMLRLHRRLAELKTGRPSPPDPNGGVQLLTVTHSRIRDIREEPENREMSLRKFLDVARHREAVRELFWLYRCLGVEQQQAGDVTGARQSFVRSWAIGEALFPVTDRGRVERLDRVFLAELGDVYARLGRYDLMLRYMYSDQGLPALCEMAKPISDLTRVAEAFRLARHDESDDKQPTEVLPETVSQILFEQPMMPPPSTADNAVAPAAKPASQLGRAFIVSGSVVLIITVAWRLTRASRRPVEA